MANAWEENRKKATADKWERRRARAEAWKKANPKAAEAHAKRKAQDMGRKP
jgi:hypothetical protein